MKLEDYPIRSMSAVRARDRAGWLSLFEDDAVVEDPVGGFDPWDLTGEGQRGHEAIGRFYDIFSAAQESLDFEVHYIAVCAREVACFVTMNIVMKGGAVQAQKMINIYKISPNGKIASLRSFWN